MKHKQGVNTYTLYAVESLYDGEHRGWLVLDEVYYGTMRLLEHPTGDCLTYKREYAERCAERILAKPYSARLVEVSISYTL